MTGMIKKGRGKGDITWVWIMNVKDEACACVWRERLKEAVTEVKLSNI